MGKKTAQRRFRFTKKSIEAITCPESQPCVYVYDSDAPGLAVRVFPSGKRVFVWLGKLGGRTTRKNLGTYPSVTILNARKAAMQESIKATELDGEFEQGRKRDISIAIAFL